VHKTQGERTVWTVTGIDINQTEADLERAEMIELGHVELEHGERCGAHARAQLLAHLHPWKLLKKRRKKLEKKSLFLSPLLLCNLSNTVKFKRLYAFKMYMRFRQLHVLLM